MVVTLLETVRAGRGVDSEGPAAGVFEVLPLLSGTLLVDKEDEDCRGPTLEEEDSSDDDDAAVEEGVVSSREHPTHQLHTADVVEETAEDAKAVIPTVRVGRGVAARVKDEAMEAVLPEPSETRNAYVPSFHHIPKLNSVSPPTRSRPSGAVSYIRGKEREGR